MTITNGYLTTEEARDYCGLSDLTDTELLDATVEAVSRLIDNTCQRNFYQVEDVARTFATQDAARLRLGAFNDLVEVTSLKFDRDGDGVFEEEAAETDYEVDGGSFAEAGPYTEIHLFNSVWFPIPGGTAGTGRTKLTEVTGTWGWPDVPAAITQATRIMVSRIMKRQESPQGVAGFGEYGVVRISRIDPDVMSLLAPYRLLDPGIA